MILTGLPGVIVSRARRSAWRGEGWEQGSQRLWKPRGGCRRFSGTPALLGSLQGLGAAPDTWVGPWQPASLGGSQAGLGAIAGLDRVRAGGWRTHCRWAANLPCTFWAWLLEFIGLAPGRLYKSWLLPSPGSGSPWLPTESQGDLSHALASGLCSWRGPPPFPRAK